ncbi:TetR/AcrR family transcriptional regulator [Micromonospora sp. U21]|uniref:TetR/AcrR family transcriptional regulator n=1 Tax=Micromonospora sp. U21 TaxID=2824899 RepID=UPI0027DE3C92|nr:TetR/AcrR family transcriptional regulator [Micromonospora sp. U21]
MEQPEQEPHAVEGRSAQKRRAILGAAREVFLKNGYTGASMDDIAALAVVSKVTVYKHFADKQRLFIAVVTSAIEEAEESNQSLTDRLATSVDVEKDLRNFARQHIVLVTQPHLVQMRRMIIAEANRFPELARTWHHTGPERGHTKLAAQIEQLARRGLLQVTDPLLAAQHLNYLILSVPVNEAMFTGRDKPYNLRQLQHYADEAVRVFMAAYRR